MRSVSERLVVIVGVVVLAAIIAFILILPHIGAPTSVSQSRQGSSVASAASETLGGSWTVLTNSSGVVTFNLQNSSAEVTYLNGTKTVEPLSGPMSIQVGMGSLSVGYPSTLYGYLLVSANRTYWLLISIMEYPNSTVPSQIISALESQSGQTATAASGLSYFATQYGGYTVLIGSSGDYLVYMFGNYTATTQSYASLAQRVIGLVGGP